MQRTTVRFVTIFSLCALPLVAMGCASAPPAPTEAEAPAAVQPLEEETQTADETRVTSGKEIDLEMGEGSGEVVIDAQEETESPQSDETSADADGAASEDGEAEEEESDEEGDSESDEDSKAAAKKKDAAETDSAEEGQEWEPGSSTAPKK